ncbi:NAD-dependent deacylase [soil metagenome]
MEIPETLITLLKRAEKVCALTGAGISAESGIPTFRSGGISGVWKGMPFDQISSEKMIREDLDAVWEWFDYRRGLYQECQPNAAHFTLAEWENRFEDFTLITQNVDGLHERAGSINILELHGNINHSKCENCDQIYKMNAEDVPHEPTHCKDCQTKLRPNVVLFGELLPIETFQTAEIKSRECDLFFIVGTSALVYPAAGLAEIAKFSGAKLVEVNPEETPMTAFCDYSLRGNAGGILPLL